MVAAAATTSPIAAYKWRNPPHPHSLPFLFFCLCCGKGKTGNGPDEKMNAPFEVDVIRKQWRRQRPHSLARRISRTAGTRVSQTASRSSPERHPRNQKGKKRSCSRALTRIREDKGKITQLGVPLRVTSSSVQRRQRQFFLVPDTYRRTSLVT